jgi:hypothetical protein
VAAWRSRCAAPARAAKGLTALAQVDHLRAVLGRAIEAQLLHRLVRQRQVETIAEGQQRLYIQLLGLVRGHP